MRTRFNDARDWFFEKRFGLFIHWGLYAIEGWHEQDQLRRRIPRRDYVRLQQRWNPVKFNPDGWLDLAEEAGMRYLTITTKHHDGFCLWDTKLTPFNTMNTPYGKDVIGMLADACHRRNFPLCLYYSCADWHHPNYPNQGRSHDLPPQPEDRPDLPAYMAFLKAQVRELCTNYGAIHGFWWDMNLDKHVDPSVNALIRELQPQAVINGRGYDEGDFGTPERNYSDHASDLGGSTRPVEACQSVGSQSWGYRRDEAYFADRHLLRSIAQFLAQDANYLLNVGPTGEGEIPAPAAAILRRIGDWQRQVGEAFTGTQPCSWMTANSDVLLTRRDNVLYVILHKDPAADGVALRPIDTLPLRATLLNTGAPVAFAVEMDLRDVETYKPTLHLRGLPVNELANSVLVIKLEFDTWNP